MCTGCNAAVKPTTRLSARVRFLFLVRYRSGQLRSLLEPCHRAVRQRDVDVESVRQTVERAVAAVPAPSMPLTSSWHVGLGDLVAKLPGIPEKLRSGTRFLDRLGQITLAPDALELDGERVRWSDVVEVQLAPLSESLTGIALKREVDRLTSRLPPIPGRKWFIARALDVIAGILAVGGQRLSRSSALDQEVLQVPARIVVRGRLRRRELVPGLFASAVLGTVPGASDALIGLARAQGAAVRAAPATRTRQQAEALLGAALSLSRRAEEADAPDDALTEPVGRVGEGLAGTSSAPTGVEPNQGTPSAPGKVH